MTRILLVDDNYYAAWTLARLVELAGHEARMVISGDERLRQFESFRPDASSSTCAWLAWTGSNCAAEFALPDTGTDKLLALIKA